MKNIIIATSIFILSALFLTNAKTAVTSIVSPAPKEAKLAERVLPLDNRYAVDSVNEVFKKNILLNLYYLSGKVKKSEDINWQEIVRDTREEIVLNPGEVFAYHDDVSLKYKGKKIITTNAHFNAQEGFLTDGYLYGDGVCHLASIMNWVAKDAGLEVSSPTRHDFANIPDVPREYGTSIYSNPNAPGSNQMQNLYIENNFTKPVRFVFEYSNNKLSVVVYKDA